MQICGVEYSHQGRFTCRVEASTDIEKAEMSIDSYVRRSNRRSLPDDGESALKLLL